jgi:hypothetical protein
MNSFIRVSINRKKIINLKKMKSIAIGTQATKVSKTLQYPSSVITSWQVRASVFKELCRVVFVSVGAGSSSPSVAAGIDVSETPPWISSLPLVQDRNHLQIALRTSDGERRKCAAL